MQTATSLLRSTSAHAQGGLDARGVYREAFAMARRMIRDRRASTVAASWTWFLAHARRRFTTPAGWRIAQLAGRVVFDQRTPTNGTSGDVAALLRQGLVRRTRRPRPGNLLGVVSYRCATVDRVRSAGLTFAWSADLLASSGNRALRLARAVRLREDRARWAEVAQGLAEDRRLMERGTFYALTDAGRAALAGSEVRA